MQNMPFLFSVCESFFWKVAESSISRWMNGEDFLFFSKKFQLAFAIFLWHHLVFESYVGPMEIVGLECVVDHVVRHNYGEPIWLTLVGKSVGRYCEPQYVNTGQTRVRKLLLSYFRQDSLFFFDWNKMVTSFAAFGCENRWKLKKGFAPGEKSHAFHR